MSEKDFTLATIDPQDPEKANKDLDKPDASPTKAAAAVSLRIAGANYSEIATTLGYANAFRARQAVEGALARSAGENPEGVEQVRQLTEKRLERLLRATMPAAIDNKNRDQLAYVRTALAIIDRHAKLRGVDAPQQMVVHSADEEQVKAWVEGMVRRVGIDGIAAEAEIIDVEFEEVDRADQG